MYPLNPHQSTHNPAKLRARLGRGEYLRVKGRGHWYTTQAVLDAMEHIFSTGAYEERQGATPLERRHGIPNYMDI